MVKKISFIGNKVAQRILTSFVMAALIPITILGVLSFHQVSEQLREQTAKALHKNCKSYAFGLIERLTLINETLHLLANHVSVSSKATHLLTLYHEQNLEKQFSDLVVVSPKANKTSLFGKEKYVPILTEQDLKEINTGKPLIKHIARPEFRISQLWMAINLVEDHPEAGILLAELKSDYLWTTDIVESNEEFRAFNESGDLLFASITGFQLPSVVRAQILRNNSGKFTWKKDNTAFLGAYWKIPMKGMFSSSDIIIVQSQPEDIVFAPIRQFTAVYPPVIVLAVLIVGLLSTRLITKYLTPLERLKAATLRIADGDFNCRVNVASRDEFEELADSFNEMTRRLRNQFDILSTMAEIDRNILSSQNAEEIVETALSRLPDILLCDSISIASVDPSSRLVSDIRVRGAKQTISALAGIVKLSQRDVRDLLDMKNGVIEIGAGEPMMSAYLENLGVSGDWRYLIIPVHVNGALSSLICLGYQAPKRIPHESRSAARNFGDRIAVALSNAAWEEKLYQQAHYDPLTGLPNRLVLNDRLAQELVRAKRDDTQLAVLFIDLDRFKNINDSLGHAAGDELLKQVSKIFVNCVRETDLVVRIGGDEFVVVISDLHNGHNPMSQIRTIADKILTFVNQTLIVAGHPMTFTASLGIAVFPGDAANAPDLLKNADAAMYHAKNEGRANFRFYSPELNAAALENIKLEQELRGAIARNELVVYYQPKVDSDGRIVGAEALIRWKHTELGMISPAKFIPLAEQTGLIVDIGDWIFEETCLWVKSCHEQGLGPLRVSVNLSAIEFKRPDLVQKIEEILARTGVDPDHMELELTESVAVGDIKTCVDRMNELKALGLTLAMDDFGTGFSSLSYLKNFPLDVLKIDQAFVRQLESDTSSQAIVGAIIALANGLAMEIVAEGVETESQLDYLKQHHCEIFQGFFFSRPVPGEDFLKLLIDDSLKRSPKS
jgi:diguanylate cyclase (GGDEF)-like protein